MNDDLQICVDKRNCLPSIRTAAGPARLAVIDNNGKVLEIDNIEGRITDAVIDAVLGVIAPEKMPPRPQAM